MKFLMLIAFLVGTATLTTMKPALAWDQAWCYANHVTTGACAHWYPPATATPAPTQSQNQNQGQTQNQTSNNNNANTNTSNANANSVSSANATANGGNANATGGNSVSNSQGGQGGMGGSSSVTNNVSSGYQGQQNLPVAPLAGCDSGASVSIGGSVGRDSGFLAMSNTTLYAAATFPIGKRHCVQQFAPVAPVTNVYYPLAPPAVLQPTPAPVVVHTTSTLIRSAPCVYMTASVRTAILKEIHRLRPTKQKDTIARDLTALHAACVPDSIIAAAIDG